MNATEKTMKVELVVVARPRRGDWVLLRDGRQVARTTFATTVSRWINDGAVSGAPDWTAA